ncbi:DUF3592 domain-containing protein [Rhizobium sp. L51/94]|uniref:DUF3592 domain-containing protein n=1 Tax=Rhizobium sp. L51/94 TaxID=2819999 RepID=UPI001C5BAB26|nr:DUF3592 domain-containing protein [Rhizobium sp. L51/94]QXZ80927.1 hypothetical protein J5274_18575 [Rhizobium sp. L51/94]
MNFYTIVFYISVILFLLLGVANRARRLLLVAKWTTVDGTIIGSEHRLTGEATLVYIDVKYNFEGIDRFGFDLNTNSLTSKGFEIGRDVKILINPAKSYDCRVATSEFGDVILRRLLKIPAGRNKA